MANLPVVGKVPKGWVIGVVVISGGVLAYAYTKHKKTAASAATATTSTTAPAGSTGDPYPPDGTSGDPTDPNSTDPQTGMTYGDEGLYGGGSGGYGTSGFGPGGYSPGSGSSGGTGSGPGSFATNASWAQYAEQQLAGVVDAGALSSALGVYLTGSAATSTQVNLIDQAIAVAGYPPVAGAANFPPNIKQGGSGPGGGGGVTGLHAKAAFDNLTATWNPVSGATGYTWSVTEHQGAQTVASGTTSGTTITARGLKQKTGYAVHVTPQPGGTPAVTYVTTQ